jgi:hypothetical protein
MLIWTTPVDRFESVCKQSSILILGKPLHQLTYSELIQRATETITKGRTSIMVRIDWQLL